MIGTNLESLNLDVGRLANLLALSEALTRIGQFRTGDLSGQFSIHNFQLRAAYDSHEALVILMRAGILRRHAWFCSLRVVNERSERYLELTAPQPLARDWNWEPAVEEIKGRLLKSSVWDQSVEESFDELLVHYKEELKKVQVVFGKKGFQD